MCSVRTIGLPKFPDICEMSLRLEISLILAKIGKKKACSLPNIGKFASEHTCCLTKDESDLFTADCPLSVSSRSGTDPVVGDTPAGRG